MAESVYALIPDPKAVAARNARYQSKFSSSAGGAPTCSTFGFAGTSIVLGNVAGQSEMLTIHPAKKNHGTFGVVVAETVKPDAFLKKSASAGAQQSSVSKAERHVDSDKKPPIPTLADKPVMGLKTDKNFVVANAVENILAVSRKQAAPQKRAVERDDYGKTPEYIHQIKNELSDQYKLIDQHKTSKAQAAEKFHQLTPQEAYELRSGLQHRWDLLNKEFQTMGFSVETYSQKKHQEHVEAELKAIEQALQKIRKTNIIIFDDTK